MSGPGGIGCVRRAALPVCLVLAALGLGAPAAVLCQEEPVVHVVLVWLKEPGNPEHRERLVDVTRELAGSLGARELRVGEPLPSARGSVDDSFDVGLYMVFDSAQSLGAYLDHPAHLAAVREVLRPLARRSVVYDFVDRSQAR